MKDSLVMSEPVITAESTFKRFCGIKLQSRPVLSPADQPLNENTGAQLRDASGFVSEPGCPGFSGGQECTVKTSAPAVLVS